MKTKFNISLGPLEREILCLVWRMQRQHQTVTAKQVQISLSSQHALAYTTISTILKRLTNKGLLQCHKNKGVNHYRSLQAPEKTLKSLVHEWLHNMLDSFGAPALAAFADEFSRLPPEQLEEFKQQLKSHG